MEANVRALETGFAEDGTFSGVAKKDHGQIVMTPVEPTRKTTTAESQSKPRRIRSSTPSKTNQIVPRTA
ncbi:hypothetical protein D8674_021558 [Pyrus ussuriensis x Pyrus communis]|uniref:Uncharacterized protein n=1 Tax=Pyrus ussuriensis x Pyrus communis TaxID=2448454 RepID=A0A5N5GNZ1_9ROSA|nr:hypothetical protein D8674_021558 [Pyrus ussuriensis x Pyrus communis]